MDSIQHQIICRQPSRYLAWPTVSADSSGKLFVVFSGDRDAHVCPFGKIFLTESADAGQTWSEPRVVIDTPLDDRDPGIYIDEDGTMIVSWVTSHYADYRKPFKQFMLRPHTPPGRWEVWEEVLARVSPETVRQWAPSDFQAAHGNQSARHLGFWTLRSRDGGVTWDTPALSPVYAPHGPCFAKDGGLWYAGLAGSPEAAGPRELGVVHSADGGRTWEWMTRLPSRLPYPGQKPGGISRLAEPHLVETASGKLLVLARYEESGAPDQSFLWQFESVDGGKQWSQPRRISVLGKPPHLLKLKDGRLLVSYGFRLPPFGQRVSFSADDGITWEDELILRNDAPNRDLGYASSAELPDGSIVTVYYQVSYEGEPPALMASRFFPKLSRVKY